MVLLTLAHHIDLMWLEEAYRRTRKDGAVDVDGVTAEAYEERLLENLSELLERFKSGQYRAPPVRRVHIPKAGTAKMRPIGIPTLEDKILQRAVLMVLEPVYEQDFLDCSYGFRPGRGAHQAVQALWDGLMDLRGGWTRQIRSSPRRPSGGREAWSWRSCQDNRRRGGPCGRVWRWLPRRSRCSWP